MKKLGLLFLLQFAFLFAIAQQTTYLTQSFSTVPPTGWTIDAQSSHWTAVSSTNAGGTSKECQFDWKPQFTGISRLITGNINTTGATTLFVSFKHALSHYGGAYTVGVASRSNAGAWTTIWSIVNPSSSIAATQVLFQFSNTDIGSATTQLCFFFNGNSYNINDWWIDDFTVFKPYTLDAKMNTITTPSYIAQGNVNITGAVINYGTTNLTSLTLNYNINSGTTNTTNVSSINIAPGQSYNYTCTPVWAATPGNYTVKTWISGVNGVNPDSCHTNDTLTKVVSIATQSTSQLPLYEEFTSSTCAPCASFNSGTFTPFITAHPNAFSLIKYQMNWPSPGDPYYTAEGGTRRTYYGVSGVPDLYIDGGSSAMTTSGMATELSTETAKATFFVINITPSYSGTTITVPITIDPYVTGSFKVYTVVVEKTTTGNVGNNGETSWTHVMMKMLPNGSGSTVSFTAGTPYTQTYTQNLSTTHVEEMSDLQVVVFVQETSTKEVFQSKFADVLLTNINESDFEAQIKIFPNPSNGELFVLNAENSNIEIIDILGKVVYSALLNSNNEQLNLTSLSNGSYLARITNQQNVITRNIVLAR